MKNIVVIGAGQLGSRHLQALSKVNFQTTIEVVDPFAASLEVAKARFDEMPANSNVADIRYVSSISQLSTHVDLAIIATNADVRAEVICQLVTQCEVKSLVLEKVLFQKTEEYEEIQSLLEQKEIKAWVNHPRRMFPYYAKLAKLLEGSKQVSYQVQGGDWGLACNGLHFIDHLAFLTGCEDLEINTGGLNPSVITSKRKGYFEVSGALSGKIGGHPFELFCHENASPVVITICADNLNAIIDEGNGWVRISTKENEWQWVEGKTKIIYFQSELSNKIAEDILGSGQCDLPTYTDATKLHIPFINAMLKHINRYGVEKHTVCPIT
ncbi:MAG: Gfo/Idh/MocA family oxidoreductase [Sideroxyarcus sp.]|nr:Gfo/Idh/MocA family oxidoreductase [Sideroxyarcus sp.]